MKVTKRKIERFEEEGEGDILTERGRIEERRSGKGHTDK